MNMKVNVVFEGGGVSRVALAGAAAAALDAGYEFSNRWGPRPARLSLRASSSTRSHSPCRNPFDDQIDRPVVAGVDVDGHAESVIRFEMHKSVDDDRSALMA